MSFLDKLFHHPVKANQPTAYTGPYTNGMGTVVQGTVVPLEVAEKYRAIALAKTGPGSQNAHAWAGTLPHLWAIQDMFAGSNPILADSAAFSAATNCNYARTFLGPIGAGSTGWCPKTFVATPDPTNHKLFIEGAYIPDGGSFSSDRYDASGKLVWTGVWIKDLDAIFAAAIQFAMQYGAIDPTVTG
jgi:hypothetical protein